MFLQVWLKLLWKSHYWYIFIKFLSFFQHRNNILVVYSHIIIVNKKAEYSYNCWIINIIAKLLNIKELKITQ